MTCTPPTPLTQSTRFEDEAGEIAGYFGDSSLTFDTFVSKVKVWRGPWDSKDPNAGEVFYGIKVWYTDGSGETHEGPLRGTDAGFTSTCEIEIGTNKRVSQMILRTGYWVDYIELQNSAGTAYGFCGNPKGGSQAPIFNFVKTNGYLMGFHGYKSDQPETPWISSLGPIAALVDESQ